MLACFQIVLTIFLLVTKLSTCLSTKCPLKAPQTRYTHYQQLFSAGDDTLYESPKELALGLLSVDHMQCHTIAGPSSVLHLLWGLTLVHTEMVPILRGSSNSFVLASMQRRHPACNSLISNILPDMLL